jgi:hypothetical protein
MSAFGNPQQQQQQQQQQGGQQPSNTGTGGGLFGSGTGTGTTGSVFGGKFSFSIVFFALLRTPIAKQWRSGLAGGIDLNLELK